MAAYLAYLHTWQYAPTTLQTTVDALKRFSVQFPATSPPRLSQDRTLITAEDGEAWLPVAHQKGLAPATCAR